VRTSEIRVTRLLPPTFRQPIAMRPQQDGSGREGKACYKNEEARCRKKRYVYHHRRTRPVRSGRVVVVGGAWGVWQPNFR